jgi:acetyl-CoA carboxylase biotin carboxyl carrier protein
MANKKVSRGRRPNRDKQPGNGGVPSAPSKGVSVADEASGAPRPFDVRTVQYLIRLMQRFDLSEVDLREGDQRIRLQRGGRVQTVQALMPVSPGPAPAVSVAAPPPAAAAPAAAAPAAKPDKKLLEIKSPTPGTFYSAANPNADAFVRVGTRVTPETVVCIIEAMKIFNEINADCTGVVREICVENQQPVEFGQVLFRVDPAG